MPTGKQGSLAHDLVLKLGKPIASGKWTTQTPFPTEQQLCAKHGISRSVVREAIKVLRSKGLIDSRPKRGTVILDRSQWNFWDADVLSWLDKDKQFFEDLAEFRLSVEPRVASLCAQRASVDQIQAILEAGQRMEDAAAKGRYEQYDEADFDFHQLIADACGNRLMQQMMKTLNPLISLNRAQTRHLMGEVKSTVPLHRNLATAIGKRQTKKSSDLMIRIIEEAKRYAIQTK